MRLKAHRLTLEGVHPNLLAIANSIAKKQEKLMRTQHQAGKWNAKVRDRATAVLTIKREIKAEPGGASVPPCGGELTGVAAERRLKMAKGALEDARVKVSVDIQHASIFRVGLCLLRGDYFL